ncbi:MAG: metal-dependent hydrolase [Sandaracinus sp.]|nr:metal-dependent hydrolase [Sandaracinus sp.]|tara:strand:+ start:1447 stop:2289 length:843 start_codon:yes stop_codon:yes gene_type:complete
MARIPTVRRLRPASGLEAVPLDWYGGDLDLSMFWDALSAVFPEGEKFFVRAVREHRDQITDPELRARVDAFIGQEAAHGTAHRALNRSLEDRLPGARVVDEQLRWVLAELAPKLFGPRQRLAITCALEHFTALLAKQLLEDPRHRQAIDPRLQALWLWHAYEEVEHEAVAFDVYQSVGGHALERGALMALTTALFVGFMGYFFARVAQDQGRASRPRTWARVAHFLWVRPGLTRRLVPDYLAYYRPGFHPESKNTGPLLAEWRERLFGAEGAVPLRERAA